MNRTAEPSQLVRTVIPWRRTPADGAARRLSLRMNFSWTFVGNVVYAACQWGMLVALAKFGTLQMVGAFALGLAITAPIFMFTNLNLRAIQATDAKGEFVFATYLGLRLVATGLAMVIVVVAAVASGLRAETLAVVLIVGVAKTSESLSDIVFGVLQQHERMDRIAISAILKGTLSLVALVLGLLLTHSLVWASLGWAVAWIVVLVRYDLPNAAGVVAGSWWRNGWDLKTLYRLGRQALPLGFVTLLISLNTNIPRYILERRFSAQDLGVFAAMAYLMVAGNTVVSALGQSASPRLAQLAATGEWDRFRRLLRALIGIGMVLGSGGIIVAVLAGRLILTLMYRPEFAEHVSTFGWLMVAAALFYVASFLGVAMTAARYFRVQAPLFVLITAVTVVASTLLIPRYGLDGAAWTVCLTSALQLIGSAAVIWYVLRQGRTMNEHHVAV